MANTAKIAVHVTPRGGKDAIMGVKADAAGMEEVHIKVTAPPDGGKANKAVCQVLAKSIGVPKSAVEVVRGTTSRHKLVEAQAEQKLIDAWYAELPRL